MAASPTGCRLFHPHSPSPLKFSADYSNELQKKS